MEEEDKNLKELFNLYENNRFEEAISFGNILLKDYSSNPVIYNILGAVYLALNQKNNALNNFKKAIQLSPNFVEAYVNIANIYKDSKHQKESLVYYDSALRIKPDFDIALLNKGNLLLDMGKYHEAADNYNKAIAINPKLVEAYNNLGSLFESLKKPEKAIENYNKAIALKPEFIPAYRNLSKIYITLEKNNEAISILETLLTLIPKDPLASHTLSSLKGEMESSYNKEYAKILFNSRANIFEEILVNQLQYDGPNHLLNLLKELNINLKFNRTIDLGCGTGLSGLAFKDYSKYILGVDLSENMIELSKQKEIYDDLIIGEINDIVIQQQESFDLVISADVFTYLGDLNNLFSNIRKICKKDSLFIFSTELNSSKGFKLNKTGRYSHSNNYIKEILKNNSFDLLKFKKENLRKEKEEWLKGGFYITKC